ncbi:MULTISPECIES: hypothetical protein [unclassified Pseudomonas]|uniref:hypothetical protein n=1 Tax=unclassified Pseudomonas TaxID=196821 RepID=UPI000A1EDF7F|nr:MULTISPECIES: hypothetical protein [unclassified Pseudomonas]
MTSPLNKARWQAGLCGWLLSTAAYGLTQEIRAVYIPDPADPQTNRFVNQTPQSGYCAIVANDCKPMSGVRIPVRFSSVQAMEPGHTLRDGAMFNFPAQWRSLEVRHVFTGETATVGMRIGGLGSEYVLSDTAANLTGDHGGIPNRAHDTLWGGRSWGSAPPPCLPAAAAVAGDDNYRFFWFTPVIGTCAKQTAFTIPWMTYSYLDVAYELQMPDPLKMSAGLYTGELTYGVGPGMDFDTGDNLLPDSSQVTFRFVLDVQHVLKVDIPPGGNKVALVPQGGWSAWLHQGRKPERLFRDQAFTITSSSRFKMFFECQHGGLQSCGLRSQNGGGAPAQVFLSVSLPDSITDSDGRPVRRQPLSANPDAPVFQPGRFLDRTMGTLHFEVPRSYVEDMLQPGQANRYVGNVTVIWDSEV